MKKLTAVLIAAAALAACSSPQRPQPQFGEMPRATPTKRIAVAGGDVVLPDGSRAQLDASGGFTLPNGERVVRDARGALVLPNGNRCVPDTGGYLCP